MAKASKTPKTEAQIKRETERAAAQAIQKQFDAINAECKGAYIGVAHEEAVAEIPAREMDIMHEEARRLNYRIDRMVGDVANARVAIATFATKVVEDPAYQMGWSSSAFEAAAVVQVYSSVLPFLRTKGADFVSRIALQETVRAARSRPSSSSATSNLMEACRAEVFAKVAEMFSQDLF